MKFKSALLTHASGKIGGMVASHNRGGLYMRSWAVPTNPNSNGQNSIRAIFGFLATRWGTLTSSQRLAWKLYGENVPTTNAMGDTIYLTGQQWYIACNAARMRGGLGPVDDGPTVMYMDSINPVSIVLSAPATTIGVVFDNSDDWVDEDDAGLIVQIGLEVSPGVNFYDGPFIYTDTVLGNSTTAPTSPDAATNVRGGFSIGNRAFARIIC